jgi:hypothetical protein
MGIQTIFGSFAQSAADADTTEVVRIPVNKKSRFEVPLIRVLYISLRLDPATVMAWLDFSSFSFTVERYPVSNFRIAIDWRLALEGAGGRSIDCVKEWDSRQSSLPLIASENILFSIATVNTNNANEVFYTMFYEEIENPTELELTMALIL